MTENGRRRVNRRELAATLRHHEDVVKEIRREIGSEGHRPEEVAIVIANTCDKLGAEIASYLMPGFRTSGGLIVFKTGVVTRSQLRRSVPPKFGQRMESVLSSEEIPPVIVVDHNSAVAFAKTAN